MDTSVWVDSDRGIENAGTNWLHRSAGIENIGLTNLILCELLRGCRDDLHADQVEASLRPYMIFAGSSESAARQAAAYYRDLRSRGITVASLVDCMTAAFCIQSRFALLHRDHDYDAFEKHFGLLVIHPD